MMEDRQIQIEAEYIRIAALLSERSSEFNIMRSQLREANRKLAESKLENIKLAHAISNLRGEHLKDRLVIFTSRRAKGWKILKKFLSASILPNFWRYFTKCVINCVVSVIKKKPKTLVFLLRPLASF